MNAPLLTIAIPIFNAEKHLSEAIQSVLNQTFQDFELILINDGSTDNSINIMTSFNDKRISIVNDGKNYGLIERLNQSVDIAKGKYYARMDADDIMYISRIQEQVDYLETHPDVDVVGSSVMTIDDDNNIIGSGLYHGKVDYFVHPTVLGKVEWFRNNPYTSWALRAEDTELWLRTSAYSNFWAIDKPLMFYREFGIPNTKKYITSQKTLLKIFSRYREYKKGFFWYISNSCLTVIKIFLYLLFDRFGKIDYLVSKRNRVSIPFGNRLSQEELIKSTRKDI